MTTAEATCRERVGSHIHRRDCGRPVKDHGLCGIHLAAQRRREQNLNDRLKEQERERALRQRLAAISDRLLTYGVKAEPQANPYGTGYLGLLVHDPEHLLALLEGRDQ